jgi:hypothetical protein
VYIDGHPLAPTAQAELDRLIQIAALAQAAAPPDQRATPEIVATSVLTAFRLSHRVGEDDAWQHMPVIQLGAATVRTLRLRAEEKDLL